MLSNSEISDVGLRPLAGEITLKDHKYKCKHCCLKFQLPALLEHLEQVIPDVTQRTITCPICFEDFQLLNSYINHVINKHNKNIAFNCIGCSLFFLQHPITNQPLQKSTFHIVHG